MATVNVETTTYDNGITVSETATQESSPTHAIVYGNGSEDFTQHVVLETHLESVITDTNDTIITFENISGLHSSTAVRNVTSSLSAVTQTLDDLSETGQIFGWITDNETSNQFYLNVNVYMLGATFLLLVLSIVLIVVLIKYRRRCAFLDYERLPVSHEEEVPDNIGRPPVTDTRHSTVSPSDARNVPRLHVSKL